MTRRRQEGIDEEAAIRETNDGGMKITNNVITKNKLKRLFFSQIVLFLFSLTYHLDPHTTAYRLATSKCDDPKNDHTHPLVNSIHLE